jgi:CheY-like chemotaxis protein
MCLLNAVVMRRDHRIFVAQKILAIDRSSWLGEKVNGNSKRILHVEDSRSLQQLVGAILSGIAEITWANNLKEARLLIKQSKFDLVLLDFTLPDGSGSDFINELEALAPTIPIIIFSAHEITNTAANVKNIFVKGQYNEKALAKAVQSILSQEPITSTATASPSGAINPVSNDNARELAKVLVELYNKNDVLGFYYRFDNLAKIQFTQDKLTEIIQKLHSFAGRVDGFAYSHSEPAGMQDGKELRALFFKLRLSGGTMPFGKMKLTVTQDGDKLRLFGFFINVLRLQQ